MKRLSWILVSVMLAPAAAEAPPPGFVTRARIIDTTFSRRGEGFTPEERQALTRGTADQEAMEKILDARCLFRVSINPESRVKVAMGGAKRELAEGGWRGFLVRVENEAGVTAKLRIESPSASEKATLGQRWLALEGGPESLSKPALSGDRVEYRILSLYSSAAGKREAKFTFQVGQGTQDLGFRGEADVLFKCAPASEVTLKIRTSEGKPGQTRLGVMDLGGREWPPVSLRALEEREQKSRLVRDGQTLRLAAGEYRFRWEDLAGRTQVRAVKVGAGGKQEEALALGGG